MVKTVDKGLVDSPLLITAVNHSQMPSVFDLEDQRG
jgi:hypothetical protein